MSRPPHARLLDERLCVAGGLAADRFRHVQVGECRVDLASGCVSIETPGFQIVVDGDGRERALMVDDERRDAAARLDDARQRHLHASMEGT